MALSLANKITIGRIVSIPFFIAAIVYSRFDIALAVFLIATISDGLDGFIARAKNERSTLGTILDPVADKLLLMSSFICLSFVKNASLKTPLPPYVSIAVISRDVLIVIGSIIVYLIRQDIKVTPSPVGKVTTFFQMITIVSVLVNFKYSAVIWNTAVVLTAVSGLDYLIKGSRLLSENNIITKRTL